MRVGSNSKLPLSMTFELLIFEFLSFGGNRFGRLDFIFLFFYFFFCCEIAVATRLLVSLLKAPQVRVETAMAPERLRQIKADFPVLSIQPGGELRDQAVGPSPCLLTVPSQLPLLYESASSILADGLLCASDFLQVS